jgi:hypothetical protein
VDMRVRVLVAMAFHCLKFGTSLTSGRARVREGSKRLSIAFKFGTSASGPIASGLAGSNGFPSPLILERRGTRQNSHDAVP